MHIRIWHFHRVVLSLLCLHFYGAGLLAAEPASQQASVHLTEDEFLSACNSMTKQGLQPVSISACEFGNDLRSDSRYTVIWEKKTGTPWQERHNLDTDRFQEEFDSLKKQGFRPTCLCVCSVKGDIRCQGVFEQTTEELFYAHSNLTIEEYKQIFDEQDKQGYWPVTLTGSTVGKETRITGIWEVKPRDKKSEEPRQFKLALSHSEFQRTLKSQTARGYRMAVLGGYTLNNQPRYVTLWERGNPESRESRPLLTLDEWKKTSKKMEEQQYWLMNLSGFTVGGKPRVAALWEAPATKAPSEP
jgi:hypothetical protein